MLLSYYLKHKHKKIKSEDSVQKKNLPDKLETFKTLQKVFRKTHKKFPESLIFFIWLEKFGLSENHCFS